MSTRNPPPRSEEPLKQSMMSLERALGAQTAGREYQWSASVADALDQVLEAMESRPGAPASGDVVDKTRPTLARQADGVRREFTDCLDRAEALHEEIKLVSHHFAPKARAKVRGDANTVPDFTDIRRRVADLIACLQHIREDEANLILESVNTDIGVGD